MEKKYIKLVDWIERNGGFVNSKLFVKNLSKKENGRVVFANSFITNKEKLLVIPSNLRINYHHFDSIPNINKWVHLDKNSIFNSTKVKEFISLLYEKSLGKKSFYYPYLNLLPNIDSFLNNPLQRCFDKRTEIQNIISPFFCNTIKELSKNIKYISKDVLRMNKKIQIINPIYLGKELDLMNEKNVFLDAFKWANLIFISRHWKEFGLVPFGDLFQHSYYPNLEYTNDKQGSFVFQSNKKINDNEQIYNNYGNYSNLELYLNYGFESKEKLNKMVFDFKPIGLTNSFIIEELKKNNLDSNLFFLTNKGPSTSLIKCLRILSLDKKDISLVSGLKGNKFPHKSISDSNQKRMLKLLLKIVLDLKKGPYNESRKNICQNNLKNSNEVTRTIARIILKEYEILDFIVEWVKKNTFASHSK